MATLDTVKEVLESNLDIDPENVTEDATFEDLGIDSLDMVELICDLEEKCSVDFGEPEGLTTVGDLVGVHRQPVSYHRPTKEPASAGSFLFFGKCAAGRKRVRQRENAGAWHRGRSETRGRTRRLRQDAGTHAPASAGSLRAVAARKPCEHGGSHNEQTDRRHASDA